MSEEEAIDRVDRPLTRGRLTAALRDLGVSPGETLIVHSAMSALGWVCVDATTVVDALRAAVTDRGTLVVPTHTGQYTDPAAWRSPPIPSEWVETVIEQRPPFRPGVTPARGVGAVPECLRTYPGAHRSRHPTVSFAAWGRDAEAVVADHPYDGGLGAGSPLEAVSERGGRVLLLGVGHDVNTSLHLAEHRATYPGKTTSTARVPVVEAGEERVVELTELDVDTGDFPEVGSAFEAAHGSTVGTVGAARATLLDQPALVDFATDWFEGHRG
ncbi:MAG: aminoglycoside N(3)-acetyltransferase [Halobacteriales archaeon]